MSRASPDRLKQLEERPGIFRDSLFANEDIQRVPLTRVVAEVFKWVESPIELNKLVSCVANLLEIKDYPVRSLETDYTDLSEYLIDPTIGCDTRLEAHETLQRLWEEIRALPPQQRDTFYLSFADENGDDLFSLLLRARVVTLPQLARELDLSVDQLMALWQEMPMNNVTLSSVLNVSRPQINKWRFRAIERLKKRVTALVIKE